MLYIIEDNLEWAAVAAAVLGDYHAQVSRRTCGQVNYRPWKVKAIVWLTFRDLLAESMPFDRFFKLDDKPGDYGSWSTTGNRRRGIRSCFVVALHTTIEEGDWIRSWGLITQPNGALVFKNPTHWLRDKRELYYLNIFFPPFIDHRTWRVSSHCESVANHYHACFAGNVSKNTTSHATQSRGYETKTHPTRIILFLLFGSRT